VNSILKGLQAFARHSESRLAITYRRIRSTRVDPNHDQRAFLFEYFGRGSVGAEIGVHRGQFSAALVRALNPQRLYLIDPWRFVSSEKYATALYGRRGGRAQKNMDRRYAAVLRRFSENIENGQAIVIRATSNDACSAIPDGTLDWVYIDGDHSYDAVLNDLRSYLPKLRLGGIMAGDDFGETQWFGSDVVRAVHDFTEEGGAELVEVRREQFVLRRPSGR
jgi:hypothetical protein